MERLRPSFLLLALLALSIPAVGQCRIAIIKFGIGDESHPSAKLTAGQDLSLFVRWHIDGIAPPYRVAFTAGKRTNYWDTPPRTGEVFGRSTFPGIAADEPVPVSITIDPEGHTGSTKSVSGVVPIDYPKIAVEYYDTKTIQAEEGVSLRWTAGSGQADLNVLWGKPLSQGWQKVTNLAVPVGTSEITTTLGRPALLYRWTSSSGGTCSASIHFTAECSAVRVNPELARKVTWDHITGLPKEFEQWTRPEARLDSTSDATSQFVSEVLPAGYKKKLGPYETARRLFQAIVKRMTYGHPKGQIADSSDLMREWLGDCGGYSTLFATCCRSVGIPARPVHGWWADGKAAAQTHCIAEFYLPGIGWLPADGSSAKGADPTGETVAYFGSHPGLNGFVAISWGADYSLKSGFRCEYLHLPVTKWVGSAHFEGQENTVRASVVAP